MVNVIVMVCGIILIVDAAVLAYRIVQSIKEVPELTIERVVAASVAFIAAVTGVFFIGSI